MKVLRVAEWRVVVCCVLFSTGGILWGIFTNTSLLLLLLLCWGSDFRTPRFVNRIPTIWRVQISLPFLWSSSSKYRALRGKITAEVQKPGYSQKPGVLYKNAHRPRPRIRSKFLLKAPQLAYTFGFVR